MIVHSTTNLTSLNDSRYYSTNMLNNATTFCVDSQKLDGLFSALGHPVRRTILDRLARGEATVTEIAAPFDASLNAISRHLKVLEQAGLLHREIRGREHYCRLNPAALNDALEWLEFHRHFWNQRLDAMETLLRQPQTPARSISNTADKSAPGDQ